ncbi:MAG: hypothetical protein IJI25_08680 [Eubacterium sp.]|nr:hypothetical protein [Eubacterium sp.]
MITFKAEKVFMNLDTYDLLSRLNLEEGGLVQKAIDKAVIDWNMQYVPFETGTLAKSPYSMTDIGSGEVIYPGPYAHYLYYGEVYGPNIPIFEDDTGEPTGWFSPPGQEKHPTGRELHYSQDINPLAGSYWFERMKADHLDDIIKEAKANVGL